MVGFGRATQVVGGPLVPLGEWSSTERSDVDESHCVISIVPSFGKRKVQPRLIKSGSTRKMMCWRAAIMDVLKTEEFRFNP